MGPIRSWWGTHCGSKNVRHTDSPTVISNVLCITDRCPYFNCSGSFSHCRTYPTFQLHFQTQSDFGLRCRCLVCGCSVGFVLQLSTLLTKRLGRRATELFKWQAVVYMQTLAGQMETDSSQLELPGSERRQIRWHFQKVKWILDSFVIPAATVKVCYTK